MKRVLFVVAVLVLSVASVSAQTSGTINVPRKSMIEIVEVLKGFGANIIVDDPLPASLVWPGGPVDVNMSDWAPALNTMLRASASEFEAVKKGDTYHIRRKPQPTAQATNAQESSTEDYDAKVEEIKNRYAARYGSPMDMQIDLYNAMNRELYQAQEERRRAEQHQITATTALSNASFVAEENMQIDLYNAVTNQRYYQTGGAFGGNYGWGSYGFYPDWYDRCVTNNRHRSCRMGGLRIQADRRNVLQVLGQMLAGVDRWETKVDVYIQGPVDLSATGEELDGLPLDKIGPAAAFLGKNDTMSLPVGRYRIYILLVEKELVLYEQVVRIQSEWDTRRQPTVLRVDAGRFRNEPLQQGVAKTVRPGVAANRLLRMSPDKRR